MTEDKNNPSQDPKENKAEQPSNRPFEPAKKNSRIVDVTEQEEKEGKAYQIFGVPQKNLPSESQRETKLTDKQRRKVKIYVDLKESAQTGRPMAIWYAYGCGYDYEPAKNAEGEEELEDEYLVIWERHHKKLDVLKEMNSSQYDSAWKMMKGLDKKLREGRLLWFLRILEYDIDPRDVEKLPETEREKYLNLVALEQTKRELEKWFEENGIAIP